MMLRRMLALSLIALCIAPPLQLRADELTDCYQSTIGKSKITYTGAIYLEILRLASGTIIAQGGGAALPTLVPLMEARKPKGKKCTSKTIEARLAQAPDIVSPSSAYLGVVTSPVYFRRVANLPCGSGATYLNQYFMIGDVILFRDCDPYLRDQHGAPLLNPNGTIKSNAKAGYIYFWGYKGTKDSSCIDADYPTMYASLTTNNKKLTIDNLRDAETKGIVGKTDAPDAAAAALANEVAAEMIAEQARDFNLKYLNLMLLDIVGNDKKPDLGLILGGYCPAHVPATSCDNTDKTTKGLQPIAWGGAQKIMMNNGNWGKDQGANSTFGKQFEAGLIEQWLTIKQKGTKVAKSNACVQVLPAVDNPDRKAFKDLLVSMAGN